MNCPYCGRANRDAAKVCAYCGRRLPQRRIRLPMLAAGCLVLAMVLLIGLAAGWYLIQPRGFLASVTPTGTVRATATASPQVTPTVTQMAAATPSFTLSPSPPTATPLPTVTVPPIAGPKRFDPVGANKNSVSIADVNSGTRYPFFQSPGRISGSVLSAAWSPDGKRVLISFNWNSDVYDYGHIVRITDENGANPVDIIKTGPSREGIVAAHAYRDAIWSPDGRRIAVRYQYGSDFGIWLFNADGTGKQRLETSHIGDWPRFWSVDGAWVIGVSSSDNLLYAEAVDGTRRVRFEEIKGIKMYDQRYYPWRVIQEPVCTVTGQWYYTGGAYWDCQ